MSVAENLRASGAAEASVLIDGARYDLPIRKGTLGPDVIDINTLYQDTGCFTYDPGFTSTASCESKITFIDGDKGILLYRGYPIDQLAEYGNFIETCYLLLYGELPTREPVPGVRQRASSSTRWCMSRWRGFTPASAATRIRWRSWSAWSARSRPSITTPSTSTIRCSARSPASA